MTVDDNNNSPESSLWKWCLTAICIGIMVYGYYFYSESETDSIGSLVGKNLIPAIFGWLLFKGIIARNCGKVALRISFLALFFSLIAGDLIGYARLKHEALLMLSEMRQTVSSLSSELNTEGNVSTPSQTFTTTTKAEGALGKMAGFINKVAGDVVAAQNDYLLELDAIGFETLLDVNRIARDRTFDESNVMIQQAKRIVEKYRNRSFSYLDEMRTHIFSLDVSEDSQTSMLKGFDRTFEENKAELSKMWALEKNIVTEAENIIDHLSSTKSRWEIEGGQILFFYDEDLTKFNTHVMAIAQLAKEQEEGQQNAAEKIEMGFLEIEDIFD